MDYNNFIMNTTIKGIEIMILEHILADILKVLRDNSRLYDECLEVQGHRRTKV